MSTRTSSPLDALWQARSIIWMLIAGEGIALVLALAPGVERPRLQYFWYLSLATQWILVCTLAGLYLIRKWIQHLHPNVIGGIAVVILLGCAWGLVAITDFVLVQASVVTSNDLNGLPWRATVIALTVGLLGLAALQAHWRYRQFLLRVKQAELETLQARVRPHFLFNTLNSAATLVHLRPDDAERVLLDLADLFRAALSEPGWVPLQHELDLCRRYLAIEQQRFGDKLEVEWQLLSDMSGLSVPLLTVQPLVENAVAHGLDAASGRKTVRIVTIRIGNELRVEVENAVSPSRDAIHHNGHRIGLAGVRARVESTTQGQGTLTTDLDEKRFIARLQVPVSVMP